MGKSRSALRESCDPLEAPSLYVDIRQFQRLSGLPFATLEGLVASGKLKVIVVGRRRHIRRDELDRLSEILNQK